MTWLCLHLDEKGRPCPGETDRPLSLCALHRPAKRVRKSQAEYLRKWREKRRNAGMASCMEGA